MRVNVYVPDDLAAEVRLRHPGINASQLYQDALRGLITCRHDVLVCSTCAAHLPSDTVVHRATDALFAGVMEAIEQLLYRGGTAEGLAQVVTNVARRHNVRLAFSRPVPRLTRGEREAIEEERRAS